MKDKFKGIRVQMAKEEWEEKDKGKVRIHYDFGPCWFMITKGEARELALKILLAVDHDTELPLDEKHMTDL